MENTKVKEIFVKEYPCFDLYKVICKNGVSYNITQPKEIIKREKEETLEGKKFTKTGYHKAGKEIHKNGKQKGL